MVKKVVIQAVKLHNNKPKSPLQATAKKKQNLKAPLLLTAPQRLMMKLIQKAPTPL